jgi:hypothetical protein
VGTDCAGLSPKENASIFAGSKEIARGAGALSCTAALILCRGINGSTLDRSFCETVFTAPSSTVCETGLAIDTREARFASCIAFACSKADGRLVGAVVPLLSGATAV